MGDQDRGRTADEIVAQYHGADAVGPARKRWDAKFEADAIPEDVRDATVTDSDVTLAKGGRPERGDAFAKKR